MNLHHTGQRYLPWAGYLFALAVLETTFGGFFSPMHGVGHDYANALPQLLDGFYWYINNGISSPPWFTPAFCAGVPLFADPQWVFYAPLQFFAFFINPLSAAHLTLLFYCSLGYCGMYLLLRRHFGISMPSAIFIAILWTLNGFTTHRMIVGHIGFIGITLIPLLAYLLMSASPRRPIRALAIVSSGVILASWVHSGLGTLILAAGLSVWGLICIAAIRGAQVRSIYVNGIAATLLGLGLSASKLTAAMSTMSHLERTMYPLPGFSSLPDLLLGSFGPMLMPSQWVQPIVWPLVRNVKVYLDVHEWTLYLTPIPFVLMLAAVLVFLFKRNKSLPRMHGVRMVNAMLLLLILLFSLSVQLYTPDWNAFLKTLPLVKSISTPTRWLVLWLPIICVSAALALDYLARQTRAEALWQARGAIALTALLSILVLMEPRSFYQEQGYDPNPIIEAYAQARVTGFKPRIEKLGAYIDAAGAVTMPLNRNDLLIKGMSQAFCANPLFGYWLETYQPGDLAPGNMLRTLPSGHLNIKNPACYTFPEENDCKPFDHFRADQLEDASNFIQYRPWSFKRSGAQVFSDRLTAITLIGSALVALFSLFRICQAARNRRHYD